MIFAGASYCTARQRNQRIILSVVKLKFKLLIKTYFMILNNLLMVSYICRGTHTLTFDPFATNFCSVVVNISDFSLELLKLCDDMYMSPVKYRGSHT